MKVKLYHVVSFSAIILVLVGLVFALPVNKGIDRAKDVSPVIDDEGNVIPQLQEDELTKIVFIRYAPKFAKDKPCNNDGVCDADEKGWCGDCNIKEEPPEESTSTCYTFLSGAKPKWNWVEDYYYNDEGLGASSKSAVSIWEGATTGDIFGDGISGDYPWGVYDYKNSISFGNYPDPNVIGVTAIWYQGKKIYEYDIMYDIDYFPNDDLIDLDTVVLHELGHGAGLGDLYDIECDGEVMYGYYGGIKTNLRDGDIAGIKKLYG